MSLNIAWMATIILEVVLLFRGWKSGHLSKFPIFFFYISLVFLQSVLLYVTAHFYSARYSDAYWTFELVDVFVGCAVVVEIYRIGLAEYAGVRKMARNSLLFVFSLTFGRVVLTAQEGLSNWSTMMTIQLERDMRFVQIGALLTLLLLLSLYAVPIGRNLCGILLGYGTFLGTNILNLALMRRFGNHVQSFAAHLQSWSYVFVLIVWTVYLWSYAPRRWKASSPRVLSYAELYAKTRQRLGETRGIIKDALHLP